MKDGLYALICRKLGGIGESKGKGVMAPLLSSDLRRHLSGTLIEKEMKDWETKTVMLKIIINDMVACTCNGPGGLPLGKRVLDSFCMLVSRNAC